MYFGGDNGFNVFYPERFADNSYLPPVVLTSFKVFEREIALGRSSSHLEQIDLGHRDNFFAFEFAALSFRRPDRNRYRYRLEGLDEDWIDPGSRRHASYTKVPPGDYLFRVQGSNNDGVWNYEGASVRVKIRPPPWRTWWAWGLYLGAAVALALGYLRSQRAKLDRERAVSRDLRGFTELKDRLLEERAGQIEEREQLIAELEAKNAELERFTYTVSHDLRSPLVTIKGFLGLLQQDAAAVTADPEVASRLRHDVERIGTAADRMDRLLSELLELSRIGRIANPPQEVPFGELAGEAVEQLAGPIAEGRVAVDVAPDLPAVTGDRVRLLEVLQNLIENAVRYMGDQPSPRIEIGVRDAEPSPVFLVRDNGIGIEPRYHRKIFRLFERLDADAEGTGIGLALARRIVEVHGGRIWVESQGRGQGSTFCFTLPEAAGPEAGAGGDPPNAGP